MVCLLPASGFFGAEVQRSAEVDKVAADVAALLECTAEPMLAHVHSEGDVRHFVFVTPADHSPTSGTLPPTADNPRGVAWRLDAALGDGDQRLYAALALRRLAHVFAPVEGDTAVVGVSGAPRPLVKNADARRWARAVSTGDADKQWKAFLAADREAARRFRAALVACDRGDGAMIEWAATVASVADISHDIINPIQGIPLMPEAALWAPLPNIYEVPDPLPLTSQMLVRLPPQSIPPGPIPTHASARLSRAGS